MTVFPSVLPGSVSDVILGTGVVDFLTGFYGNDIIRAGAGNDVIVEATFLWPNVQLTLRDGFVLRSGQTYDFGRGNDSFDGGAGIDLLTYNNRSAGIVLDLAKGTATTGAEIDRFVGIEGIELGGGADIVFGNRAGFVVDLSLNADRLVGIAAQSLYIGGEGVDTIDLSRSIAPVVVSLDIFSVHAGVAAAQVQEFETVLGSMTAANSMRGNDLANTFLGGAGNDVLDGRGGQDSIVGGIGSDKLYGGVGNDVLVGGLGNDIQNGGDGNDLILGGDGNDTLFGAFGQDTLDGGNGNDYLSPGSLNGFGSGGSNVAYGGAGNDYLVSDGPVGCALYGGAGNDVIVAIVGGGSSGDDGDDKIYSTSFIGSHGGAGFDTLFLGQPAPSPLIHPAQIYLRAGLNEFERIVFTGTESRTIQIQLSNLAQHLSAGKDTVFVAAGFNDNTIYSDNGADNIQMTGGLRNRVYTGDDNDSVTCSVASAALIDTGAGNDNISSALSASTIRAGTGDDYITLSAGVGTVVSSGAGSDRVKIANFYGTVDMGEDNDQAIFNRQSMGTLSIWSGIGQDDFDFLQKYTTGHLSIMDFDIANDKIHIPGTDSLSDLLSVTQYAGGVRLIWHDFGLSGLQIDLVGQQLALISDLIFAA